MWSRAACREEVIVWLLTSNSTNVSACCIYCFIVLLRQPSCSSSTSDCTAMNIISYKAYLLGANPCPSCSNLSAESIMCWQIHHHFNDGITFIFSLTDQSKLWMFWNVWLQLSSNLQSTIPDCWSSCMIISLHMHIHLGSNITLSWKVMSNMGVPKSARGEK